MNWLKDPFKRFLYIYWGLAFLCVFLLIFTREAISFRMIENNIAPLLESELQYLEALWQDAGPAEAERAIQRDQNNIFKYQFKELISDKALKQIEYRDIASEPGDFVEVIPVKEVVSEKEDLLSIIIGISQEDFQEEVFSTETWLPVGHQWQRVVITISPEYIKSQIRFIEPLLYSVAAILLVGLLAAHYMIQGIKTRLNDVNQTSIDIRRSGNARHRIPGNNLSGPLAETIDEINAMLEELEASAEKTRQQANNIAHDLRTPLTSVYHRIQHLAQHHPELTKVENMTEKLLTTFNTLLKISRLESSSERIEMEDISLSSIVQDVVELYGPVLEDRRQTLSVHVSEDLRVFTSRELLFHVLCNILDNSCKFNSGNGEIAVWTEQAGHRIILHIADQSGGVGEAGLKRLCEKFYRSDQSRQSEGNGLGLSFVSAAVNKMGGSLSLSDAPLNHLIGLKVSISLPAQGER